MVKKTKVASPDPRFAKFSTDPKFRTIPQAESKIEVGDRFSKLFTDPEFYTEQVGIDETGRKVEAPENDLKRLYTMKGVECVDEEGNFQWDVESSDEEPVMDEDVHMGEDFYEDEEEIPMGETTKKISIQGLDWKAIRAADIYALFDSMVPGKVKGVTIYPSEYGLSKMNAQAETGPDIETNDDCIDAYRQYELDQLRYYFAIANFKTTKYAEKVYDEIDGYEFEQTSNTIDIRYVPHGIRFPNEPTQTCDALPKNYKPNDFFTRSLQHTVVKNTWDMTPIDRERAMQDAFADLDKVDQAMLVASGSEQEHAPEDLLKDPEWNQQSSFTMMNKAQNLQVDFGSDDDDNLIEKPKKKKSKRKRKVKIDKQERDTLNLLVDDDFKLANFKPNVNDPRFSAVKDSENYQLDPTDKLFNKDKDGNKKMMKRN